MAEDPQKNLILFLGAGDHIQMKKSKWGLTLDVLWEEMSYLDDLIEASSEYAFDPDLGYLTSHVQMWEPVCMPLSLCIYPP